MKNDGLQAPMPDSWGKIHDIRWFSENLNSAQFRALSSGLGLGTLKAAGSRGTRQVPAPTQTHQVQPGAFGAGNYSSPQTLGPQVAAGPQRAGHAQGSTDKRAHRARGASAKPARRWFGKEGAPVALEPRLPRSFASRISVWTFDFLVVVVSLAVAFAAAVVISMVKTGETDNWLALRPVKFLSERSGVEVLASVYAIFAVYMIVFKLGAGKTFGEVIFKPKRAKNAPSVTS